MERAQHLSTAARLNVITTAWQVRSALRIGVLDLVAAIQRERAIQAQAQSEKTILQLMEQRLAAGAVAPAELYPARVAVLRTRADVIDLTRQVADARARIADALGLPLKAIESLTVDFPMDLPSNWNELSPPEVRRTALKGRADLLALIEEYEASQAALRLEIARQYPDVHLSSNYQWDQGENKWQLGVTFELPIFNQNHGPIKEAEAKRAEIATRFTAAQARAINEIDRALSTRKAVADQLKEAESIVQTHREQLSKMQGALQQGGADRVEVETAALELRSSERTLLELKIKAQQAIGMIEDALQRPINAMRTVEQAPQRAAK
jgi:outer membrane protein TolC